jgi:tetratricopeptide (TPR) repeat protein/O-antigen ligase
METRLISPGRSVVEKILDIAFIPLLGIVLLGRIWDFPGTTIILIVVPVIYTTRNVLAEETSRGVGFSWLDISTLVVMTSEIVNYFTSTYRLNTLSSIVDVSFLFLLYWTIRVNLRHEYQFIGLLLILVVFGAYFTARVIYVFRPQYQHFTALEFTDLSDFRERIDLLTPNGMPIAEWITLFLMFLPFPILLLIKYKHRWRSMLLPALATVLLVLVAIAISFSRALYISAFSFFLVGSGLCLYYRVFPWRRLALFNGMLAFLFLLIIAFSPIAKPFLTTTSIVRTSSQIRSLQGRVNTWATAPQMVRSHPLLGIGSYNFPMQYVMYRPANTVYVGRALNCVLQILIEKGVLGLFAYGVLLFAFLKTSHQRVRSSTGDVFDKSAVALFVAVCVSAIVRDLSYFSILTNKGAAALLCFMFAFNAGSPLSTGRSSKELFRASRSLAGVLLILALMIFSLVSLRYGRVSMSETAFRSFVRNFSLKQNLQAGEDIDNAISASPGNAYYVSNKALLVASTLKVNLDAGKFDSDLKLDDEDRLRIKSAIDLYNRALELNPADDCFNHNLGWLYYFLGQRELAFFHFRRAIDISGDVPLYHVSLGLLYERTNAQLPALSEYAAAIRLSPSIVDSDFFQDLQARLPREAREIVRANTFYFEDQRSHGNDPIFNGNLGKLYLYTGRVADATGRLQESTLQLPTLSRPWLNLGQCYELVGNEKEAKLSYERAAFLEEANYSTWDRLGNLAYRQQQWAPAIAYYQKALAHRLKQSSIHSERVLRVYRSRYIVANDIIPTNLLAYSEPSLNVAGVYSRLAEMYRASGNQAAASYFDNLKAGLERGK